MGRGSSGEQPREKAMITHVSASSLEQYERCQVQWKFRRIDGLIMPPGIAAHTGRGVHKGAEVNMKAKRLSGEDEPIDVVLDAARDGYVHSLKETGLFVPRSEAGSEKTQMNDGLNATVSMAKVYREKVAPSRQPKFVEKELYSEVKGLPVPLMGIIDLVTVDGVVSDLKTGAKKWNQGRADNSIQATMYDGLLTDNMGKPRSIEFDIVIRNQKEPQILTTTRTEDDWGKLVMRSQAMLRGVELGAFNPTHPDNWWCSEKWCGFWHRCQYISIRNKLTKG